MIQRILLAMFIGWFAIAPAIASSCAAECANAHGDGGVHHLAGHSTQDARSDLPDCHQPPGGDDRQSNDTDTPKSGVMAAACFAAAAAMHVSVVSSVTFDPATDHDALVLLPHASFVSSPPYEPPRA